MNEGIYKNRKNNSAILNTEDDEFNAGGLKLNEISDQSNKLNSHTSSIVALMSDKDFK